MEQLHTYISQARQQGQSDEQIRQALVAGGWSIAQVTAALGGLGGSSQTPSGVAVGVDQEFPVTRERRRISKGPLLVMAAVVVIVLIVGAAYAVLGGRTSYEATIQQFITAVDKGDKATAVNLESPASKARGEHATGISSFYDDCHKATELCLPFFSSSYQKKATKTVKAYVASDGTKGQQVTYTLKQAIAADSEAGTAGCSITSNITIAAVPHGKKWLVEIAYVDPDGKVPASLCAAPVEQEGA